MEILTPQMPAQYKGLGNIMIDIETFDTADTAVILSISCVEFCDKTGATGAELEIHIDPQSCLDNGGTINWETVAWWMVQPKEAIEALVNQPERYHILTGLVYLTSFITHYKDARFGDPFVWANSPRFDLAKIVYYCNRFKMQLPWKYSNEMDVRSYTNRFSQFKNDEAFSGIKHNGIDDCKHQIKYLVKTLNHLPAATPKNSNQDGNNS